MSWTSLDEDDATSSCDDEDFVEPDNAVQQMNRLKQLTTKRTGISRYSGLGDNPAQSRKTSSVHSAQEQLSLCNPFVQEPSSDNEINSRKEGPSQQHEQLKNLLASKDDHIRTLQKLINGQREQLYHFLTMSLKEETLLELKQTCRETEAINQNENICMALDKFKYENNLPTEQTTVRENVSKTLLKIERLMRHQVRLVKAMESGGLDKKCEDTEAAIEINCLQRDDQLTDVQKLLKSTEQIQRKMHVLKIQLKKLALIEQERIDLVERVYSMPSDQRQYYAHLAVIEKEKIKLQFEIDKLSENYRDLKQKCYLLEEAEQELTKCIDSKIAGLDLNKIKPGLETHLELMEMVERGELSLITMTKDEKGKFTDDFVKLYNENAEISERLKDFDEVTQERDELKRQIEVLVENCLRLQSEVKALRLASRTDDLLEQLRQACLEREQLRTKLERLAKEGPGILRICGETAEKIAEERDQLRLKLTEYLTIEEDLKSLRFKASQSEAYRVETERLKVVVSELEEVKAAHIALLDKSGKNRDVISPLDRDMYRNISKQLEHMKEVEKQRERLIIEMPRYKHALLKQEDEIKALLITVDKLTEQVKILRKNPAVNPAEGIPEGPEITPVLSSEEEKRLEMIRSRIRQDKLKPKPSLEKNTFITSVKSFLGFENLLAKTLD